MRNKVSTPSSSAGVRGRVLTCVSLQDMIFLCHGRGATYRFSPERSAVQCTECVQDVRNVENAQRSTTKNIQSLTLPILYLSDAVKFQDSIGACSLLKITLTCDMHSHDCRHEDPVSFTEGENIACPLLAVLSPSHSDVSQNDLTPKRVDTHESAFSPRWSSQSGLLELRMVDLCGVIDSIWDKHFIYS